MKQCPYCQKNALQETGKLYGFDVKEWRTTTFITYKCRWCKRSFTESEEGIFAEIVQ